MRLKCAMTNFASGASTLLARNEPMTSILAIARTVRGFGMVFLLSVMFLMSAAAQPRISLHIERVEFNGNLLKFPDGTFIAESFGELYRGGRSTDYQFGIVVLEVDKNGKGTGTLAPVCKIKFNKKNELEIENYGQKPLRLANVYLQK